MSSSIDRIKFLETLASESPDDPFVWYGLALEYRKSDFAKSYSLFEKLLKDYPDYLPTYYQIALMLSENGEKAEAMERLKQGVKIAKAQNDLHALAELQSFLQNLMYEDE
jgi:tetratricopeptide (TPR) repeat protein